jgi:hypothetical protein
MIPGSVRSWIAVNAVQQFSLNKHEKNQLLKYPSLTLVKNKHHMNPLIRLTLGALVVAGLMASIASASTFYPAPHG